MECAITLNNLNKTKQEFLKGRSKLSRCQGCDKLRELKQDEDDK